MKRKITIIMAFLSVALAQAQQIDKSKLDQYFQVLAENNKFMGSIAVSKNGKVLYSHSVGFTDLASGAKANENSKYRIGSISKTFTAVLIFKAVEENKLDLNKTIDQYFPTIKNANKITIQQLLYHRSGIHNFTNDESYTHWNTQPKSEKEMVEIIAKGGSDFEPDSKANYSNSGFVLLTYILEKTYKKTYAKLLEEKIVKPLGLKNTYFGGKINGKNNECNSYSYAQGWKKETETDMSIPLGAGGIVSTPTDLTKFGEGLFTGKLISKKSLEQMETIKDNYGMGLFKFPFNDKICYGHTGGIDGFSSTFSYFPTEEISFAITSNALDYKMNNIALTVLGGVFGKSIEIPEFKTYDVKVEDLGQYTGVYSSKQIPIQITVTKDDKTLIAQATGQSSFPLSSTAKDKFEFAQAGVILEFKPTENTMVLKQGGGEFTFTKE
ncbi:serine hydrolase domain-containing protein [Flavobacterium sp. '19STA2R22 D10 B1']|uniref:serine hydrolase domain-containing protein n=1 Tax=Flavobacterium aerium TaxID=3037261 RepID=UPI00278C43DC|nr:serine hydrolase domain-containing protein [Flavobacterium sp. '19STA2R22 D10 B1']